MTYHTMQSMQMSSHASAAFAGASFSCPSHSAIVTRLDAITMASIIIIRRVSLAILGNSLLQLVLLLRKISFEKNASVENIC